MYVQNTKREQYGEQDDAGVSEQRDGQGGVVSVGSEDSEAEEEASCSSWHMSSPADDRTSWSDQTVAHVAQAPADDREYSVPLEPEQRGVLQENKMELSAQDVKMVTSSPVSKWGKG